MLHRELLLEWVNGLPTDAEVGIDDGGPTPPTACNTRARGDRS
jgi:hypothetical protein